MQNLPSVFISYSHNDQDFARKLANNLRPKVTEVWLDEENLKIGNLLTQKILEAIQNNNYFVIIISKNSASSKWVQKELDMAMGIEGRKDTAIPVLIEKVEEGQLPESIRNKVCADFTDSSKFEISLDNLLKAVGIIPPPVDDGYTRVDIDGQYVAYKNGIVYDTITDLEWFDGPDRDVNWHEAKCFIRSVPTKAGDRWRLPIREELRGLYQKGNGKYNRTRLLKSTKDCFWSGEIKGGSDYNAVAWSFRFDLGEEFPLPSLASQFNRFFAVRSLKDKTDSSDTGDCILLACGSVLDKKTGLEWYVGPDKYINWEDATKWTENLKVDGGNWRMPTIKEMESLYKDGRGPCNMSTLLKTIDMKDWWQKTSMGVWSSETEGEGQAYYFSYRYGSCDKYPRTDSTQKRVFAVRSRKEMA